MVPTATPRELSEIPRSPRRHHMCGERSWLPASRAEPATESPGGERKESVKVWTSSVPQASLSLEDERPQAPYSSADSLRGE